MTEHAQSLEVVGLSTIPELDAHEVPLVWGGTGADFNSEGGSVIRQTLEMGIVLRDLGHVEERDDGLVSSLDEQDLKGVSIKGNALQSGEDGVHGGATRDWEDESEICQEDMGARHLLLPIPAMSASEKTLSSCQLTKFWTWLM